MERWSVAVNGYFGKASVYRDSGPWWTFAVMDVAEFLCDKAPDIRIPLVGRIKIVRDGEVYTIAEYYGDTLAFWAHMLHNSVFQWAAKKQKVSWGSVPLKDLIVGFGGDAPSYWKEAWDRGTEQWAEDGPPNPEFGRVFRTADGSLE